MPFTRLNNMYRISRTTGVQNNILGVCFFEEGDSFENSLEIIK